MPFRCISSDQVASATEKVARRGGLNETSGYRRFINVRLHACIRIEAARALRAKWSSRERILNSTTVLI